MSAETTTESDDLLDEELIAEFVEESLENLDQAEQAVFSALSAGAGEVKEPLTLAFRGLHSVKGSAGFLHRFDVERFAHNLENLLAALRDDEQPVTDSRLDLLLRGIDLLRAMLSGGQVDQNTCDHVLAQVQQFLDGGDDEAATPAPAPVAPAPQGPGHAEQAPPPAEETVRVKTSLLDELMVHIGEMVISRNRLTRAFRERTPDFDAIGTMLDALSHSTSELQWHIMQTRLQPVSALTKKLPRLVRDVSRKLGKQISLVVEPSNAELDRTIIEALSDPLTHLLRNACDHGIESPDKRVATGKPPEGTIRFRTQSTSGWVLIHIEDDGAGIDADRVGQIAVDRGVLTAEELSRRSDAEIRELIFAPGFSTAQAVTDVSGRGVGMDVVRSTIQALGGAIEIDSELGRGTTFTLRLPLTIAIVAALVLQANGQSFCLPQVAIEEIVPLPHQRADLTRVKNQLALVQRGTVVPIVDLAEQLDLGAAPASTRPGRVIVCRSGRHRYGIYVDAIEDVEEIVVKPLSAIVSGQTCFSGASILGDGAVALVLDVAGLFSFARPDVGLAAVEVEALGERDAREQSLVVFRCDAHQFAVELALVEQIEHASTDRIHPLHGMLLFELADGTLLPALDARELHRTGSAPLSDLEHAAVMVLSDGERQVALVAADHVDIIEEQLVLSDVHRSPYALATTTRQGEVITLLDGGEILQALHQDRAVAHVGGRAFVCDASPLLRQSAARALRAIGMEVEQCSGVFPDAEEAASRMASMTFDLVVSDLPPGPLLPPAPHHLPLSTTHTGETLGQGERFVPRVALQRRARAAMGADVAVRADCSPMEAQ